MITAAQCRAARAWLTPPMRQAELAELAGCGLTTILDFETGRRRTLLENVMAIQHALEERGITFIPATSDLHGGIIGPE